MTATDVPFVELEMFSLRTPSVAVDQARPYHGTPRMSLEAGTRAV
jgi:hypothetical protein